MKTYRFISWNVNGIRAVEKKEALKWVDNETVDILGLQEIKAEEDQIPATIFDNARANNVGWRIDYFYVSEDLKNSIKDAYIMNEYMGSDHCPIALEIHL